VSAPGPAVSVVTPVFEHAAFVERAVESLRRQTVTAWEHLVVDDGSRDDTPAVLEGLPRDDRVSVRRLEHNVGLGAACNLALDAATAPWVAYLPADDRWDPDHLACLLDTARRTGATLVWTGMRHHGDGRATDPLPDHGLQLVQTLHRRTADRWVERDTFESDDLEQSLFGRLRERGATGTGAVTCEWTDHPDQRHKHLRERYDGGLNVFRTRYRVATPLRLHSRDSGLTDEVAAYADVRGRVPPRAADGLRVLLVGELAYNPERVLALAERGHELHGLWIDDTLGPHTVGPLPFDGVTDVPRDDWRGRVRALRPDVVYAQQNWRAVPLAHAVLRSLGDVPLLWHFKESPQRCITRGTWTLLRDLVRDADACLVASPEERDWLGHAVPATRRPVGVLDGDLPKAVRFRGTPPPRLSARDGVPHVVCAGRPVGVDPDLVGTLGDAGVHLHLHGLVDAPGPGGRWRDWLDAARARAPGHLHLHPHVPPHRWVIDLSVYDAGLLHRVPSRNRGDVAAASWDDLNLPARLGTYAAAWLPLLAPHQPGHRVAVQELVRRTGVGLLHDDAAHLARQLTDAATLETARAAMAARRLEWSFDAHADRLDELLREVAA
jgi:hypothetical protein